MRRFAALDVGAGSLAFWERMPDERAGEGSAQPAESEGAARRRLPPTDDDAASIFSDSVDGGDDSFEAEAPPAIPCERCSAPLSAADFFVCATCHKRLCPKHHHGGESCDRCLAVDQSLLETDDDPPPAWAGPRPPMPPQAPAVPLPVGAGSELTGVDFECPGCGIALAPKAETCPGCWRKLK